MSKEKELQKKINEVAEKAYDLYKRYNPLNNEVGIKKTGTTIDWEIRPDMSSLVPQDILNNLQNTEFKIKLQQDLVKDKIEMIVEIDGVATIFTSDANDDNLQIRAIFKGEEVLHNDIKMTWRVEPGISIDDPTEGLKNTQWYLNFAKEFEEKDMKIGVNVSGDVMIFNSKPGENAFKAGFIFQKKF